GSYSGRTCRPGRGFRRCWEVMTTIRASTATPTRIPIASRTSLILVSLRPQNACAPGGEACITHAPTAKGEIVPNEGGRLPFEAAARRYGAPLPGRFDGSWCFGGSCGLHGLEHTTKTRGEAAAVVGGAGAIDVEAIGS